MWTIPCNPIFPIDTQLQNSSTMLPHSSTYAPLARPQDFRPPIVLRQHPYRDSTLKSSSPPLHQCTPVLSPKGTHNKFYTYHTVSPQRQNQKLHAINSKYISAILLYASLGRCLQIQKRVILSRLGIERRTGNEHDI